MYRLGLGSYFHSSHRDKDHATNEDENGGDDDDGDDDNKDVDNDNNDYYDDNDDDLKLKTLVPLYCKLWVSSGLLTLDANPLFTTRI